MKQKMDVLPAILERHVEALLRSIPRDGTPFDLQPLFFGFTMDVATAFFMGHSTCMLGETGGTGVDKAQQFVDDYMLCSEEATKKMRLGPLSHFRFNSAAQRAKKRVFQYVDEYIDRSLLFLCDEDDDNQKNAGGDFMQVLAASVDNRKALRDQVLHILLASRDTTASLLSNLFFMLAKKPGIYAKLREEVLDSALGTGIPTPGQLKDMRYLKWCVNECKPLASRPLFICSTNSWTKALRLHPVIPSNGRQASRDTTLPRGGGPDGNSPLFVRKGTVVLYNIYTMHRDSGVFGAEPEEFIPERWDGLRPGWNYLPFNGGPRVCIGREYPPLTLVFFFGPFVNE
jgi:cytochrome P450